MDNSEAVSPNVSDITCKSGLVVDEARLSIDYINVNVDLSPDLIARIEQFIDVDLKEVMQGLPYYKRQFHKFSTRNYKTGFKAYLNQVLAWEPTGASALVCETGSKRPGSKNTRFSWNPSKFDSLTVDGIIFNGYLQFPSSCLLEATVSSIHLAIDIPKVRVDHQAFSYPGMRRIENRFSSGQTTYLGVKSGATRVVAYDKREEIIKSNGKLGAFLAEIKEPVPIHDLLRIELQLTPDPKLGLAQLHAMPNPFVKLKVHGVPESLNAVENVALCLARYEGLKRAMHVATFTPAEVKAFTRKLAKEGAPSWWKPAKIWEQQFAPLIGAFLAPFADSPWGEKSVGGNLSITSTDQIADSPVLT